MCSRTSTSNMKVLLAMRIQLRTMIQTTTSRCSSPWASSSTSSSSTSPAACHLALRRHRRRRGPLLLALYHSPWRMPAGTVRVLKAMVRRQQHGHGARGGRRRRPRGHGARGGRRRRSMFEIWGGDERVHGVGAACNNRIESLGLGCLFRR